DYRHILYFPTRRSSDLSLILAACGSSKNNVKTSQTGGFSEKNATELAQVVDKGTQKPVAPKERAIFHASETILTNLIHTKLDLRSEEHTSELQSRENLV